MFKYDGIGKDLAAFATDMVFMYSPIQSPVTQVLWSFILEDTACG